MSMTTEELVARRVHIMEQIDRLTQEKDLLSEQLREQFEFGKHEVGDWTLTVRPNRRLDTKAIEQRFSVAQYPQYFKPVVDLDALKANMAPVELEKYYTEGSSVIVVR